MTSGREAFAREEFFREEGAMPPICTESCADQSCPRAKTPADSSRRLDTAPGVLAHKNVFRLPIKHFLLNGVDPGTLAEIAAVIVAITGLLAELRKWRR
jgi:hypothetical protein